MGSSERDGGDHQPRGAVSLDHVSKWYGETNAVDGVTVSIDHGEFFSLVGPSGCGKTTTLRLLAGFEAPDNGSVRFQGMDVSGIPPEHRDVGVVFQNYALFPHMTVRENVAYGLKFSDPPGGLTVRERVRELLELVDLAGMERRDPESLSGGQQQRVAIARALAPGPGVLLLDEPMSALDAQLREALRVKVKAIQTELGITTIYVTHDQEEALAISDRVAVMRDGGIEQVGTPRAIYHRPASRFVAEFVGDNNVFDGTVVEVRPADSIVAIDVGHTVFSIRFRPAQQDTIQRGDRLLFCVRPERLGTNAETNTIQARVESAEFLGETTRVHLVWADRELVVRSAEGMDGDIMIGFAPSDAHIIEARSGNPPR